MGVTCQLCGFYTESHLQSHLIYKHEVTPSKYEEMFPGFSWMSPEFRLKRATSSRKNSITPAALEAKSQNGKRNLGKKRTEDWKKQRSAAYSGTGNPFYGKKHSLDMKIGLSCYFRNIDRSEFEDFTKPESFRQTKSGAFKTWRKLVFERDDFTCLLCGVRGGPLEPHHIIPRREDQTKIYQVENGATLCKRCHKTTFNREHEFVDLLTKSIGRRVVPLLS